MKNEKERVTMSNIIDEVIKRCNMVAGTMKANKIFDFAVTGSAALAIEGVINRMPHDIDIKVSLRTGGTSNERDISERERIIGIFKSWATLFPVENANIDSYKNGDEKKVFAFKVAGEISVNVFIVDKFDSKWAYENNKIGSRYVSSCDFDYDKDESITNVLLKTLKNIVTPNTKSNSEIYSGLDTKEENFLKDFRA